MPVADIIVTLSDWLVWFVRSDLFGLTILAGALVILVLGALTWRDMQDRRRHAAANRRERPEDV